MSDSKGFAFYYILNCTAYVLHSRLLSEMNSLIFDLTKRQINPRFCEVLQIS